MRNKSGIREHPGSRDTQEMHRRKTDEHTKSEGTTEAQIQRGDEVQVERGGEEKGRRSTGGKQHTGEQEVECDNKAQLQNKTGSNYQKTQTMSVSTCFTPCGSMLSGHFMSHP